MKEHFFETNSVKTKRLGEGESTGGEGEPVFTVEEVIAGVKEVDANAGNVEATDQVVSHEGRLLSVSLRAPGSPIGYSFMLKGKHGGGSGARTSICRIDYAGPNSEEITNAAEIAEYKNGAWVK